MTPAPLRSRTALIGLLALVGLAAASCARDDTLSGMVREPSPNVAGVSLPDVARGGEEFVPVAEQGELLLVYFGYTYCPDVCPTTLWDLKRAVDDLGGDAGRIDVAMVSIDPARDNEELLTAYIQSFFEDARALRTDDEARLEAMAFAFGAAYEVTEDEAGVIDVIHSSFLYAVDSNGDIQVQWPFGTSSQDMTSDLEILLRRQS